MYSSSPTGQSQWHGNIETSTDTLVPVIESLNSLNDEQNNLNQRSSNYIDENSKSILTENGFESTATTITANTVASQQRTHQILPEVHASLKTKIFTNGIVANLANASIDESITIQPEHPRMNITNGMYSDNSVKHNNTSSAVNLTNGSAALYRRRNSSNSRQPPSLVDAASSFVQQINLRAGSISPNTTATTTTVATTNKFNAFRTSLPIDTSASQRFTNIPAVPINIASISSPDGLAHALSEQNLRLQQIVHEHKVFSHFHYSSISFKKYLIFGFGF